MKRILIEGWRGIHQSLAMVNQYQLAELLTLDGLSLYHRDLPYPFPAWSHAECTSGFPSEIANAIMAIPSPGEEEFDAVYRIGFPIERSSAQTKKVVSFIVSEFGLRDFQFAATSREVAHFCRGDDLIVTPSNWSSMKLTEYGFPADRIRVIPHGVNSDIFNPLSEHERQSIRRDLELSPEDFVFLNLGSLTQEKGIDLLIQAFSEVRWHHANARLLLKDTRGLYGLSLEDFLAKYVDFFGPLAPEVAESIFQVPPSLSLSEMRLLYGAADAYISPYRAEGFNLPVIEAITCGTPVIVTKGGSTDDFCDASTALMIQSDRVANADRDYFDGQRVPGYHLEPNVDSIVEQMERALTEPMAATESFVNGRLQLVERFSWKSAAKQLAAIF